MDDESLPFRLIRPSRDLLGDLADEDTGVDFGWRVGVLPYLPDDGSLDLVFRSYTVWTPKPPGD